MKTISLTGSVSRNAAGLFDAVRQLHLSLARLPDVDVNVFGVRDEFTDADAQEWSPVRVRAFAAHGPNQFGYAPQMQRALSGMDVDILHTHGLWMYPSVLSLAWHRRSHRPYLVSPHGMVDRWAMKNSGWKKSVALRLFERQHLERAACLRALCRSEADAIRRLGFKNPICIIPNGVDLPEIFRDSVVTSKASCAVQSGSLQVRSIVKARKVLLYLGRIHPKKGLANLLKAWAQLRTSEAPLGTVGEWILAIAGWDQDGHEAELKMLASELGVVWSDVRDRESTTRNRATHDVLFLGPQFGEYKTARYTECDAFILPSLSEGLPITILEAWSHGKPIVMTPECNLPEGFAANAAIRIESNVAGIETGLLNLISMPQSALRTLGDNGRRLVAERFTWLRVAGEMKVVYDWLLGAGARPDCVCMD